MLALATALVAFRATAGHRRFVLGLWLGALLAHLGWTLMHLPEVIADSRPLLEPGAATVLLVPLGVLLVAPWREALSALPLALAVARLGCLPYACCYDAPWNAMPELAGLVALHFAARRWPQHACPLVLSGFGALRLLSQPLRAASDAPPFLEASWVALAWVFLGIMLRHRIGTAEGAPDWPTEQTRPLLRALALMLVVWLLFPLSAGVLGESGFGLVAGCLAALALLLGVRRTPALPLGPATGFVFGPAVLLGAGAASMAASRLLPPGLEAVAGVGSSLAIVWIAPVFEELLYRERLLGAMRALWGGPWALVLSSALFALGHVDPRVMPVAFAGGLVCGVVMLRTGSLAAVIGLHAGWNLGVISG